MSMPPEQQQYVSTAHGISMCAQGRPPWRSIDCSICFTHAMTA
eukprot:CAMPEP_0205894656 /NCGR_PEP_ID=MMETSP1083-20121108/23956_1 /ASSEMBLY_ACC=CAM_ASM_000430 /TAXON_ID=97485 /ORGANISM="Prymnesium parvum, Strain Texoma1" /LENGTH=42 /DNA_ID= /DNA_START= /DNA_END= /DNA_ORIENTATION=